VTELFDEDLAADEIEIPATLPVLPLKDTVVYPDSMLPLAIGQERSIELIDDVVSGDRLVALIASRSREIEVPGWDDLYEVGTAAIVQKMIRVPDGTQRVLVQGLRRLRLTERVRSEPYLVGRFEPLADVVRETRELQALTQNVRTLFARIIGLLPYLPEELAVAAANVEDPSALSHLVASTLRLKTEEKQQILEEVDVEKRLREMLVVLNRELEVVELGSKIQSQVQSEMESTQREYFLRQQLKAIQEELGEGDPEQTELKELRERAAELDLPEETRKAVDRELGRLEKLPSAAAEYGVIRTYLEWILSLPWNKVTEDDLDLERARTILDEDHFDLDKVKDRILEYLAVSKLKNDLSGPILCFVGPPGVGKTSLGQSIARTLGRKFVRISVGGVRDEAEIRGHRRTYIGAMPGTILRALRDAESKNPVFLIDEIDKMGADFRGDPASAMLEVLDPEQHSTFRDHYLDLPFDLSKVLFICTANQLETIPPPLLDRMDVIHLRRPRATARHPRVHTRGRCAEPRAPVRGALQEGGAEHRRGRAGEGQDRRGEGALMARRAQVPGGGAPTDGRARRRHRARGDGRRRRRAFHRGDGVPRRGAAARDRSARRGHAGVCAGRALLGSLTRRAARSRSGLVRGARRPRPRPGRCGAQGRAFGRDHDGDRDRLHRRRPAGLGRGRDDRRDHAYRPGAADRWLARESARRATGRDQEGRHPERERARARGAARGDARRGRVRPRGHDRGRARRCVRGLARFTAADGHHPPPQSCFRSLAATRAAPLSSSRSLGAASARRHRSRADRIRPRPT
jgi:Lon protease-like protein